MASPPTRNGTRKLSDVCRKVVAPEGITSTAWPGVRDTCRYKLGVTFDDWQDSAGRLILAKRADGKLAAMIGGVGLSVCRQVGKTYLIGGIAFALAIIRPGMLIIWSAHHARTHGETFLAMQAFAKRSKVAPYIEAIYVGSGDEEIRFRNGSRILFGARERGFGRGVPGVDMIVSDEGQIMSEKALDAQLATLNTSEFGLAIYIGTPPRPEDPSEGFTRMRTEAWSGHLQDAVWIEIGAAPGTDPNDRKQWPVWNPSHPKRTPVESILRLQRKLSAESFLREGMGIWDEDGGANVLPEWAACRVPKGRLPVTRVKLGLSVSIDRKWASVGAAAPRGAKGVLVGVNERRPGVEWVVEHLADISRRRHFEVVVDEKGPAGPLIPDLEAAGVRVVPVSLSEYADACTGFYDRHLRHDIAHMGFRSLDVGVAGAVWREIGDSGRSVWGRRKSTADVSMLEAVTLAAWRVWNKPDYDIGDSIL